VAVGPELLAPGLGMKENPRRWQWRDAKQEAPHRTTYERWGYIIPVQSL